MKFESMGTTGVLRELGQRLQRERLNQNVTQAGLAEAAGVSRRTVVKAERGEVTTVETLVGILRGLGLLNRLDAMFPEPPLSPVQLARLEGKQRQRARPKPTPSPGADPWKWGE